MGYPGSGGYNGNSGYSGNTYGGYPSYPYTSSYVNPVYYRGDAAGRSTETETTEDSTKEDYDEYLKLCSTLGLPSIPLSSGSAYSSPYTSYGGSSYNGYPSYVSYNGGYAYPANSGYTAYRYPSNSGYGYPYGR